MDQRNCNLHPSFQSKPVYVLQCRLCESNVCVRGMKAMLLADRSMELYSTDLPPPRWAMICVGVRFVYAELFTTHFALCVYVCVCVWIVFVCGWLWFVFKIQTFEMLFAGVSSWLANTTPPPTVSVRSRTWLACIGELATLTAVFALFKYWHSSGT